MATDADGALALTSLSTREQSETQPRVRPGVLASSVSMREASAASPRVRPGVLVSSLSVLSIGSMLALQGTWATRVSSLRKASNGKIETLTGEGASLLPKTAVNGPIEAEPSALGNAIATQISSASPLKAEPKVRPGLLASGLSARSTATGLASLSPGALVSALSHVGAGEVRTLGANGTLRPTGQKPTSTGTAQPTATGHSLLSPVKMAGAVGFNVLDHLGITIEDAISLTITIN